MVNAESNFYGRVYAVVRRVPRGRVVTYGDVALMLGAPSAPRAVGYALRHLPADTDVPWWRVINHKGAITYKGRGASADLQRRLLEHEGVRFGADDRTDLRVYRWWPDDGGLGGGGAGGGGGNEGGRS
jgi:methylated-DNA-protein-cysteine methyltransferase-like protein